MKNLKKILLSFVVFLLLSALFAVNVDKLYAQESEKLSENQTPETHSQESVEQQDYNDHSESEYDEYEHSDHIYADYDIFEFKQKEFFLTENISGDIVATTNRAHIQKNVIGDVLIATDNFILDSEIDGSLIIFGQNIQINGVVTGNVYIAGSDITITDEARIFGRTYLAGENVIVDGILASRLYTHTDKFTLNGDVDQSIFVSATEYYVSERATVEGNATFVGEGPNNNINGKILGDISYEAVPSTLQVMAQSVLYPDFSIISIVIVLFSLLVLVYFLISLWPQKITQLYHKNKAHTLKHLGIGFLFYLVMPLLIIFFLSTIIGLLFSIVLMGIFIIFAAVSQGIAALFLGMRMLELRAIKKSLSAENDISLFKSLFVGVFAYVILMYIPYLRVIAIFCGFCYGAGVLIKFLYTTFELKTKK